jgi:hypothetical protein
VVNKKGISIFFLSIQQPRVVLHLYLVMFIWKMKIFFDISEILQNKQNLYCLKLLPRFQISTSKL